MRITKKNIMRHELIGLNVEIASSTNKSLNGVKGKIIEETKHTITIKNKTKKIILKNQVNFRFEINNEVFEISGTSFLGRPEDRIKK